MVGLVWLVSTCKVVADVDVVDDERLLVDGLRWRVSSNRGGRRELSHLPPVGMGPCETCLSFTIVGFFLSGEPDGPLCFFRFAERSKTQILPK